MTIAGAWGPKSGVSTFLELDDTPGAWDSGKFFRSWTSSGTWETPAGGGDMSKADYDTDTNDIVDNSEAWNTMPISSGTIVTDDLIRWDGSNWVRVASGTVAGSYLKQDFTWATPAGGADNLGSHTATETLKMAGFDIDNVGGFQVDTITAPSGTDAVRITTDTIISGDLTVNGDVNFTTNTGFVFSGDAGNSILSTTKTQIKVDTHCVIMGDLFTDYIYAHEDIIIQGAGADGDITLTPTGTGIITLGDYHLPTSSGTLNQILKQAANGVVTWQNDATGAGGGIATIEKGDVQVGDADISILDFGYGFEVSEAPNTEINVSIDTGTYIMSKSSATTYGLTKSSAAATYQNINAALDGEKITDNTIDDDSPDWGSGAGQIDTDDVPEGSSNLYQLTQEEVEDYAGTSISSGTGTHTRITITYQDATGDMDFVVDDMNDDVPEAGDFTNLTGGDLITHSPTGTLGVSSATVTNGDTTHAPTCDNVYDFTETTQDYLKTSEHIGADEAYASGWNADTGVPEKDDIYDYLHQFDADDDGSFNDETWATDSYNFTITSPSNTYSICGASLCIVTETPYAITIDSISVSCNADPGTELDGDLKYADALIGFANPTTINDFNTTSGARKDSSMASGAVAANKCIFVVFHASPDTALKQIGFTIHHHKQ